MAQLHWHYGTMNSGKSTLALQLDDTFRRGTRAGVLLTKGDRSGTPRITSRLGIGADAHEVTDDLRLDSFLASAVHSSDRALTYVIADEAQFYTPAQIDELAWVVDNLNVDVHAFGLATDFTTAMFPASARLFELADVHAQLPVQALCWCGALGRVNARVVNRSVVTAGDQVLVGDVDGGDAVSYVVLCRSHYRASQPYPH